MSACLSVCICMHVCMSACTYVRMSTYVWMILNVCMSVCLPAYTYTAYTLYDILYILTIYYTNQCKRIYTCVWVCTWFISENTSVTTNWLLLIVQRYINGYHQNKMVGFYWDAQLVYCHESALLYIPKIWRDIKGNSQKSSTNQFCFISMLLTWNLWDFRLAGEKGDYNMIFFSDLVMDPNSKSAFGWFWWIIHLSETKDRLLLSVEALAISIWEHHSSTLQMSVFFNVFFLKLRYPNWSALSPFRNMET